MRGGTDRGCRSGAATGIRLGWYALTALMAAILAGRVPLDPALAHSGIG